MSNEKNVSAITDMDKDFAQWYTDIVKKAEMVDYSGVRGCIILQPYGYAIWELIQAQADRRFKETGHVNVYMPLLIPESLLQKEKDHVEGFAPEVAWVTHGGSEKLQERLCIRPTSETLFCEHYSRVIQSWRDLPKLYNQWCSVMRWEKTTRPFLRHVEFLWQEGHTAHATEEEAQEETIKMLNVYAELCENVLCMPVIKGRKTEREKFAGAKATYGIEAMMHDGKALQAGTSHNFGDGFARAFEIQFTDKNNQLQYVSQTSWGISTRLIGGIIMVHGDNNGLVLPPDVAPTQVVIIPVAQQKPGVLEKAGEIRDLLKKELRVSLDDTDKSMGWKSAEYEMRGVPVRLELGPRDIAENKAVLARRDTGEKITVSLDNIAEAVKDLLADIKRSMYEKALKSRDSKIFTAFGMEEFERTIEEKPGFIKTMWCGGNACEERIKERTTATSRVIPFDQEKISETCVCCGGEAKYMVYWGKCY
ncbi:MAG: proline--tRNA ligase [Defluviitaleaceae bacterium]|nr:proline--tRNA ligase [Defluviitaleaceae bacterium]MCL2836358.1 proline--tRNA ligase [Defluviitaleaceae bacterium]